MLSGTPFRPGTLGAVRTDTPTRAETGSRPRILDPVLGRHGVVCPSVAVTLTMTRDSPDTSDWAISTEAEFDSALQALLLAALENGLDPRGAWEVRNGGVDPDLEVLVSELTKKSPGD